ncbi:hypothetical protein [Xylocopilactobacillus apis]|uniref:Uncharacterized protein n=1 Tax=Xylocopilactobacillus apis TaxID=2932183 RepID=A0AAU9CYK3_9LACO|nr:hypothetical protein [Xylocopilactobacillus apis]BDR56484.1 hypothetical protein KIMC2_10460 [Xylocopilactobacillus apis]
MIGIIVYTMEPVLLHNMGIVYWHHSLMQVTLLIQFYSYYRYRSVNSKNAYIVFLIMTLLNPYIEWTGYVANIGFAIIEVISKWKNSKKQAFFKGLYILGLSTLSALIFCGHFLLNISFNNFIKAMKERFFSRSIASHLSINSLFLGYWSSFKFTFVLLVFLIIVSFVIYQQKRNSYRKYSSIFVKNKYFLFLFLFPMIENVLMKEHAILYTFDRMKLVFILVLIICDISAMIIFYYKKRLVITALVLFVGIMNTINYNYDSSYVWNTDFRKNNQKIAHYMKPYLETSIFGATQPVRGYTDLLFDHGIRDTESLSSLFQNTKKSRKRYTILIQNDLKDSKFQWAMNPISNVFIFDTKKTNVKVLYFSDNELSSQWLNAWVASDINNKFWINGISQNKVLFDYNPSLFNRLKMSSKLVDNKNNTIKIKKVSRTNLGIEVVVEGSSMDLQYPSLIQIKE